MLHQLSLQKLEELHAKLVEVEEILNPMQLDFTGLYNTSNHHALMVKHLDLEVVSKICLIIKEQNKK